MSVTLLAKRYAQALFDLAIEHKLQEEIEKDMILVKSVLDASRELRKVMANPVLDNYKKINILNQVFGTKVQELSLRFLSLITNKGREGIIIHVCNAFDEIYLDYNNIMPVKLTTATQIDEKIKNEILDKLSKITQKKLQVTEDIDDDLIGGFKLDFEDYQYNNSMKIQLKRLAKISESLGEKLTKPNRRQNAGMKNRSKKERLSLDFDAIFIPDEPSKAALIAPQLAYWDVNHVLLMGTNLWHSEQLIATARDYVQDAIFADVYYAKSFNQNVQQFIKLCEKLHGESPGAFEGLAYDTAMIAFQTAANLKVQSRKDLRDRLSQISNYDGVTGLTSFNANGDAWKKLYLLQIDGPNFVEVN